MTALAQVLTMVLAAVVIVWHQQRTADKMRAEFRTEIAGLDARIDQLRVELTEKLDQQRVEFDTKLDQQRVEFDTKLDQMRVEFTARFDLIQAEVAASSQRLARIEGFLGIGIPEEVAGAAAGARFAAAGANGG